MLINLFSAAACSVSILAAFAPPASGQVVFLTAQGLKAGAASGPRGLALAVDPTTPRSGTPSALHYQDTTIFRERKGVKMWSGCGSTKQSKPINVSQWVSKYAQEGRIAQVVAGQELRLVVQQINGEGNGPFDCSIESTGMAAKGRFKGSLDIIQQVPGSSPTTNAVSQVQFPLVVRIPNDIECTGSFGAKRNICIMRCQNNATNGPYGACIPVELVTN